MTFWKRLRLYGTGFALGLLIIYAAFGTRSCVTTNEMKMQELVFQHFSLSDKAQCKLKCLRKNELLLKVELRHFEVNYDLSTVHKAPCGEYFLQPKKEFAAEHPYQFVVHDCDTISRIEDIQITDPTFTCNCN